MADIVTAQMVISAIFDRGFSNGPLHMNLVDKQDIKKLDAGWQATIAQFVSNEMIVFDEEGPAGKVTPNLFPPECYRWLYRGHRSAN